MYKFAEYLTDYMNKNNISCRKAAIAINIDRTQFRRYVMGERLPKNEAIVESIAKGIDMSEEESHLLFKYYKRSRMGEQKYSWYKIIERLLDGNIFEPFNTAQKNVFQMESNKQEENMLPIPNNISKEKTENDSISRELMNITNNEEINKMIRFVCNDAKYIGIMLQTRIYSYYDCIYDSVKHNKECVIESIVELNNINSNDDVSDIKIFQKIYALMACGKSCKAYYTYNDYNTTMKNNFIISDKGLLLFNTFENCAKESVGIYADKKDIHTYYMNKFFKLRDKSYVYGHSGNVAGEAENNIKIILENKALGLKIGIYKKDNRYGLWISGNSKQGGRDVYIEQDNIVYNFNMYAEEHYNAGKEKNALI